MDIETILKKCDHTLLRQDATWEEIASLCDDGMKYGTASVCIPPCFVERACGYIREKGSDLKVCTVIGFPNGYSRTEIKTAEAGAAIKDGASEIDMVINIGELKEASPHVIEEIKQVKAACDGRVLKVIIETCMLSEEEKIRACRYVTEAGADFIKTSTGFAEKGATFEDVALLKAHVGRDVRVKAAGGISSIEDAEKFIELGADRLGTSRIVKIVKTKGLL